MNDEAAIEEEGEEEEEEYKWVVPEGYLSEDEGTYEKRRHTKHRRGIVSRPAKWPISGNKVIYAHMLLSWQCIAY